jgi:hypothetical protein
MATITYTSYRKQKLDDTFGLLYQGGSGGDSGVSVSGAYLQKTGDTATGNYYFSTNLLSIYEDGSKVGIGISVPAAKLHIVNAGSATSMYIGDNAAGKTSASIGTSADTNGYLGIQAVKTSGSEYGDIILNNNGGYVGIGIANPASLLTVAGSVSGGAGSSLSLVNTASAYIGNSAILNFGVGNATYYGDTANAQIKARLVNTTTKATELSISTWDGSSLGERIFIKSNGYVGIWDNSPLYHFTVNGFSYFQSAVYADANIGTISYSSGFAGSGWQLSNSTDISLTVDNLTVRKQMSIYELIINQIRATNGAIWVSDCAKLVAVIDFSTYYQGQIDGDGSHIVLPFHTNDIIRCQKWNGRDLKYYTATVDLILDNQTFEFSIIDGAGIPAPGDDLVRVGNIYDTARQGSIYLTANDSNAPYIDVLDDVDSYSFTGCTKVRVGKLNGITDGVFGALTGYGLYGQNVYLTGAINAESGFIGGWAINSAYLAKDTGTNSTSAGMSPTDYPFFAGGTYANRATAPFFVKTNGDTEVTSLKVRCSSSAGIFMGVNEDPDIFSYVNVSSVTLIQMKTDSSYGNHSIQFSEGNGINYGEYGATGLYINGGTISNTYYDSSSQFSAITGDGTLDVTMLADSGYLIITLTGLPASPSGLSTGMLYTNSGYIKIV